MFNFILIIIFLVHDINSSGIQIDSIKNEVLLSNCIHKLLSNYSSQHRVIVYYNNNNQNLANFLLQKITSSENWLFVLRNIKSTYKSSTILKSHVHIIEFDYIEDVYFSIKYCTENFRTNLQAKFIITSLNLFLNTTETATKLIEFCRSSSMFNIFIVLMDSEEPAVMTWYPNEKCENYITIQKLQSCTTPSPKTKNFNNCTVKVTYFHAPPGTLSPVNNTKDLQKTYFEKHGVEFNILTIISIVLNLTVLYHENPNFGDILANGSAVGQLQHLMNGNMDIALSGYATTPRRFASLDMIPYAFDSIICCAPHIKLKRNQSHALLTIFSVAIWILIGIVFLLASFIIWYFSRKLMKEVDFFRRSQNVFLFVFAILISTTSFNISPSTGKVRYIVALILFGNFVLISMYTTFLTSILSLPTVEEKYKTIEDVYKSDLKVFMPAPISENIRNQPDIPYTNWINLVNPYGVFEDVAYKHDSVVCLPALRLHYEKNLYVNSDGECLMTCYDETPVYPYIVSMATRKGFPFYNEFKQVIQLLVEGGFIDKWKSDTKVVMQKQEYEESEERKFISFTELFPIFLLVLIGFGAAFVTFLCEDVYFFCIKKFRQNKRKFN